MNEDQRAEFLEHMRNGMRRGAAANALGFSRGQVLEEIDDDEEFEARVVEAEGEASEHVEEALYQAAVSGSVAACKLWLSLRKPKAPSLPVLYEGEQVQPSDDMDAELEQIMRLTTE
jgi:hypothetical protein